MNNLWGYLTLVVYLASFACYAAFLYGNERPGTRWFGRFGTLLLMAGVLLHYVSLMERSRWTHTVPYDDLYGSMSLFAWLLAATYLGLEFFHRQRSVGAFVLPVVLIVLAFAGTGPSVPAARPPANGPLLALHITLNVLGYAAFALSFVLSVIYLIQNQLLRHHRLQNIVWRFPALETLERMSRSGVVVGLLSLLVGIAFGLTWFHRIYGHYWNGDPKEIVTLVILAVYAGYLWIGRTAAWRGARA